RLGQRGDPRRRPRVYLQGVRVHPGRGGRREGGRRGRAGGRRAGDDDGPGRPPHAPAGELRQVPGRRQGAGGVGGRRPVGRGGRGGQRRQGRRPDGADLDEPGRPAAELVRQLRGVRLDGGGGGVQAGGRVRDAEDVGVERLGHVRRRAGRGAARDGHV